MLADSFHEAALRSISRVLDAEDGMECECMDGDEAEPMSEDAVA
jgi:hypothetical protein